jgi:membrane-associated phospholipid phosphatase
VCAYAYSAATPRVGLKCFYSAWAGAIAVSTLLTHQHYLADVVTGGALGLVVASRVISKKV